MVRITIDTEKDSHHTIQKVIVLLQQFISGQVPLQTNTPIQKSSYQQSVYQENTPAGTSGYVNMFGEMPSSEPVKPKNAYADMFAPNDSTTQSTPVSQNTVSDFFSAGTSSTPSPSSSVSDTSLSEGLFDMFADESSSSKTSVKQDDTSLSSVDGFPSVLDDYTKDEDKERFSTRDYLKVQEYDE